jgi:hypothetical protein
LAPNTPFRAVPERAVHPRVLIPHRHHFLVTEFYRQGQRAGAGLGQRAATFQTLPGASFTVNGAAQAHDSALTTASVEMKWINGWSAAATFEGEFSNVTSSYAGKGVVRYTW